MSHVTGPAGYAPARPGVRPTLAGSLRAPFAMSFAKEARAPVIDARLRPWQRERVRDAPKPLPGGDPLHPWPEGQAIVCTHVTKLGLPILYAERRATRDDCGWRFLCWTGRDEDDAHAERWSLERVVAIEPTLAPFLHRDPGTVLVRPDTATEWTRPRRMEALEVLDWSDGLILGVVRPTWREGYALASLLAWRPTPGYRVYALLPMTAEQRAKIAHALERMWRDPDPIVRDICREAGKSPEHEVVLFDDRTGDVIDKKLVPLDELRYEVPSPYTKVLAPERARWFERFPRTRTT